MKKQFEIVVKDGVLQSVFSTDNYLIVDVVKKTDDLQEGDMCWVVSITKNNVFNVTYERKLHTNLKTLKSNILSFNL